MIPTTTILDDMAREILDTVVAALGADAPLWQAVTPGRPAWELCVQDQITVNVDRVRSSGPLTGPASRTQTKQMVSVGDFFVSLVRCVTLGTNGTPPDPVVQSDDARRIGTDLRLIWFGISQAVRDGSLVSACQEISYQSAQVVGPQGGKVAATMELQVQLA